ncbi:hypothetical protein AB0F81_51295, partial [Actinoplanes sp. NPDC024001]
MSPAPGAAAVGPAMPTMPNRRDIPPAGTVAQAVLEAAVLRGEALLQSGDPVAAREAVRPVPDAASVPVVAARDRVLLLAALATEPMAARELADKIAVRHPEPLPGIAAALAAVRAAHRLPGWDTALAAAADPGGDPLITRWSAWLLVEYLAADGRLVDSARAALGAAEASGAVLAYGWQTRFLAAADWALALHGHHLGLPPTAPPGAMSGPEASAGPVSGPAGPAGAATGPEASAGPAGPAGVTVGPEASAGPVSGPAGPAGAATGPDSSAGSVSGLAGPAGSGGGVAGSASSGGSIADGPGGPADRHAWPGEPDFGALTPAAPAGSPAGPAPHGRYTADPAPPPAAAADQPPELDLSWDGAEGVLRRAANLTDRALPAEARAYAVAATALIEADTGLLA